MDFQELVVRNRSYRRFVEAEPLTQDILAELVDYARQTPSARNAQPLKYIISCQPETNTMIFNQLGWAGYLKDWPGPAEGERPTGYIIMLGDKSISDNIDCDHGIAAQTILLGAVAKGYGGCILGMIKREKLRKDLDIDDNYNILLVLALGKPAETCVMEPIGEDGDFKYYRDEQSTHHVPKRELNDIILAIHA